MEILIIILGVTTTFFALMLLLEIKKHGKNINDVLNKMVLNQIEFDVLEDKYFKLKHKQQQTEEMLEQAKSEIIEHHDVDLGKQIQWAVANAVPKNTKIVEKQSIKPKHAQESISSYSSSTSEPDYGISRNLSEFSRSESYSSSDYSSSSDSYSGGGGDTGGGGSGGDW